MNYVDYITRNMKSLESIAFHTPKKARHSIDIMKYICENCDEKKRLTIMQKDLENALEMPHGTASTAINFVLIPAGIIKTQGRSPATITLQDPLTPIVTGTQIKFNRQFDKTFQEIGMKTMCWSAETKKYGFYTMSKEAVVLCQENQRSEMIQQYRDTIAYLLKGMGCEKIEWDIPSINLAAEATEIEKTAADESQMNL